MAVHMDRNDYIQGLTPPTNLVPEFVGQIYIDTSVPKVYQAVNSNTNGWRAMAFEGHTHEAKDLTWLGPVVQQYVNESGIEAALDALRSGNNHWNGANNFQSTLTLQGSKILSEQSSIGDLMDVDLESNPVSSNATVFGWTGSAWGAVEVTGVTPSSGELDFSNFINRSEIVNDLITNVNDQPLSAAQGVALKAYADGAFALKSHTHTGYAATGHTHSNYYDKNKAEVLRLGMSFADVVNPLYASTQQGGAIAVKVAATSSDSHKIEIGGLNGEPASMYMGGTADTAGNELVLNFESVRIPSGKLLTDSASGRIIFSPIRIETISGVGTKYVANSSSREYGMHLANTSIVGVNQMAFARPAQGANDGLLFPRSHAGNTQPSEVGYYNYLYILDDLIHTDATLASTKNYIQLNGRKIFFTTVDPGRDASNGDIWISV